MASGSKSFRRWLPTEIGKVEAGEEWGAGITRLLVSFLFHLWYKKSTISDWTDVVTLGNLFLKANV